LTEQAGVAVGGPIDDAGDGDGDGGGGLVDPQPERAGVSEVAGGIDRAETDGAIDGALADWISADQTSGQITGTWGCYVMIGKMARMAELTGHAADAERYRKLEADIRRAFNNAFFNDRLGRYTANGNAGADGATQTAQALALDAHLVPAERRQDVLNALVELIYTFPPDAGGPHLSAGMIGMASLVRALAEANASSSAEVRLTRPDLRARLTVRFVLDAGGIGAAQGGADEPAGPVQPGPDGADRDVQRLRDLPVAHESSSGPATSGPPSPRAVRATTGSAAAT
jgi:hypothetical protein